jgi:PDZ domain-containing secreted protein
MPSQNFVDAPFSVPSLGLMPSKFPSRMSLLSPTPTTATSRPVGLPSEVMAPIVDAVGNIPTGSPITKLPPIMVPSVVTVPPRSESFKPSLSPTTVLHTPRMTFNPVGLSEPVVVPTVDSVGKIPTRSPTTEPPPNVVPSMGVVSPSNVSFKPSLTPTAPVDNPSMTLAPVGVSQPAVAPTISAEPTLEVAPSTGIALPTTSNLSFKPTGALTTPIAAPSLTSAPAVVSQPAAAPTFATVPTAAPTSIPTPALAPSNGSPSSRSLIPSTPLATTDSPVIVSRLSDVPTPVASDVKSDLKSPTSEPTLEPELFVNSTVSPAQQPVSTTNIPTSALSDSESGAIFIILRNVDSRMTAEVIAAYSSVCSEFFAAAFAALDPPIYKVDARLTQQQQIPPDSLLGEQGARYLRGLQANATFPLLTRVHFTGFVDASDNVADLNEALLIGLEGQPNGFIVLLKALPGENGRYFRFVEMVEGRNPDTFTSFPTPAPSGGGVDVGGDNDNNRKVKVPVIVFLVVGGLGLVIVVAALSIRRQGPSNSGRASASSVAPTETPARRPSASKETPISAADVPTIGVASVAGLPVAGLKKSDVPPPVLEVRGKKRRPSSDHDVPVVASAADLLVAGTEETEKTDPPASLFGVRSTETNPSLDLDIPNSTVASVAALSTTASTKKSDASPSSDSTERASGSASIIKRSDTGHSYRLEAVNFDQQTAGTSRRSAASGYISSLGEDQSTEVISVRPNLVSRDVIVPAGRLGIVVATTVEGPVVHKVNVNSPLQGFISPGDIIVAIDDFDTRSMTASEITAIMAKTADKERKLTVLSEEDALSQGDTLSQGDALFSQGGVDAAVPMVLTDSNVDASNTTKGAPSIVDSSDAGMSYSFSLDAGNLDRQSSAAGISVPGAALLLGDDPSTASSRKVKLSSSSSSRVVMAPAGKLGLIVATTVEGPVVYKVDPSSPLQGLVVPGETIVAIDGVDTRAMTAIDFTALMAKTAETERRLTVVSEADVLSLESHVLL